MPSERVYCINCGRFHLCPGVPSDRRDDKLRERARRLARAVRQNGKGHQLRTDEDIAEDFLDATRTEALAEGRREAYESILAVEPEEVPQTWLEEAKDCERCSRIFARRWPPSGLCDEHYRRKEREESLRKHAEGRGLLARIRLFATDRLSALTTPATPQQEDEHGNRK